MKQARLKAIKAFCNFTENYEGEMTIRGSKVYNNKNELIYTFVVVD